MNFTSFSFLIFYPVVLLGYWKLPHRYRWILLLGASYFFYMNWHPAAVLLLGATTIITWLAGLRLYELPAGRTRARLLWKGVGILVPLAALGVFKYADFFLTNIGAALRTLGYEGSLFSLKLLLPVGISFYTFQTLSYVIDVDRGTIPAEKHMGYYALYVAFFPQLVAGPIEKPGHLLPQLKREAFFDREQLEQGLGRTLQGFFKKLVLADCLAYYADPVFADPGKAGGPAILMAVCFFTLQIWLDFSGYSDIACGTAGMLGIELMENFDHPYRAISIHDFWRRWHISLTKWLTEYVYIPLGGSRKGLRRTCINTMIVFLISGLWHGAGWNFVLWGALHGIYMITERLAETHWKAPARIRTLLLVMAAWLVFRAESLNDISILLRRFFSGWNGRLFYETASLTGITPAALLRIGLGLLCLEWMEPRKDLGLKEMGPKQRFFLILTIAAAWIWLLAQGAESAFIYFQF